MIKDYVCFDLETTGLSPDQDAIIEIGALRVRDGKAEGRFSCLIDPGRPLPPHITQLTGISDSMLQGGARPEQAVSAFLDFCGDDVIVGHNLSFDYRFMKTAAAALGLRFEKSGIDTLRIAKQVLPELSSRSLGSLCGYYGIVNDAAHRAYSDALATARLYQTLGHYFYEKNPSVFVPSPMAYRPKKVRMITEKQKAYLIDLCKYYKINCNNIQTMTMSEASRKIDNIILQYGRIPKRK